MLVSAVACAETTSGQTDPSAVTDPAQPNGDGPATTVAEQTAGIAITSVIKANAPMTGKAIRRSIDAF